MQVFRDASSRWISYTSNVETNVSPDLTRSFLRFSVYLLSSSGVPFENGIALTRKNSGEGDWDAFAESWIP